MRQQMLCVWLAVILAGSAGANDGVDPLPGWRDGPARKAVTRFVEQVTEPGKDFVPVSERIAVFDNDGTLWAEKPVYFQLVFAVDQVQMLADQHPEWQQEEPFASVLQGNLRGVLDSGERGILELVLATHSGMSTDAFSETVGAWQATARHPATGRRYTEMVYQPMLELLQYLRDNGFTTYIVSGGGMDFMRPFTQAVYGIPPEQVIGSTIATRYVVRDGKPMLERMGEIDFIDDKEGKPVAIHRHIGRRPIAAFGNSDGDLQMLQWTAAGDGPSFMALVHHTDGRREWAYDRDSAVGRLDVALDEAQEKGWTLIDMRRDWRVMYPPVSSEP